MKRKEFYAIRKAELIHMNRAMRRFFSATLKKFREAVSYLGNVVLDHWDEISAADDMRGRKNVVEALVHYTKDHPTPVYKDFDRLFYKFPSYYRRAAIEFVIGQVSSYLTRLSDYEEEKHAAMASGKKFGKNPPKLNLETNVCPTLYRGNMYKEEGDKVFIKVFIRNTWDFVEVAFPNRDRKCLLRMHAAAKKVCCPSLCYRYGKYYLTFPFKPWIANFPQTALEQQTVLGADLGINHGAVCSVVDSRGNVHGRLFDPFQKERELIKRILDRIRHIQKKTGSGNSLAALYTKLEGLKENYCNQLAHWLVSMAIRYGVYGIVLEHLGKMKGRGYHKDRIHHWCKKRIADLVKGLAFRYGIRVFFINPRNTSALAFDGSGKVSRDKNNFSLCTFASGKQYHCDLNASYNIAARYFLRALQNTMYSEAWEQLQAKVPEVVKRTDCTLSTLWEIASLSSHHNAA